MSIYTARIEDVVVEAMKPHVNNDWLVSSGIARLVAEAIEEALRRGRKRQQAMRGPAAGDARRLLVDRLHMDRLLHLGAEIVAAKKFVAQDTEFWGGGSGRVIFAERYDDTTNAAAEALNLLIEIVTAEEKRVEP